MMGRKMVAAVVVAVLALGGAALGVVGTTTSRAATADPLDCSSYPEKRVWLESQAWVDNQPGTGPHAGKQGHIHLSTCYPLYQTLTGTGTVHLDVTVHLHNVAGTAHKLRVLPYQNGVQGPSQEIPLNWTCNVADCSREIDVEFPLSSVPKSGWGNIGLWVVVEEPYGQEAGWMQTWFNYNGWDVFFANGKPPSGQPQGDVGGQSWLAPSVTQTYGSGSEYGAGLIERSSVPWNPATGQLVPVSGVWAPTVDFWATWDPSDTPPASVRTGKVMIDPALHANPPSEGTVVYDGAGGSDHVLSIDTTRLTNGIHKLVVVGKTTHNTGLLVNGQRPRTAGVVVIPFLVQNAGPPTTTTVPTTTTPTTTTCTPGG